MSRVKYIEENKIEEGSDYIIWYNNEFFEVWHKVYNEDGTMKYICHFYDWGVYRWLCPSLEKAYARVKTFSKDFKEDENDENDENKEELPDERITE